MNDPNAIARAIIERALHNLEALGLTPEGAAALLAVQGIVRLQSPAELASIALLAQETAEGLCNRDGLH